MTNNKIPLIAVVGPTASGKTELSVNLAKKIGAQIISADSMQIYKSMHIASAAPDIEEMSGVPHHLFEFLEYGESFSVADYVKLASKRIFDIHSNDGRAIITGGTGLYINSLIDNLTFTEQQIDAELRESLSKEYDSKGGEKMLEKLSLIDEESAKRLHPNNKRRILRAFEIYITTGKTMTEQLVESRKEPSPYKPFIIGLSFSDRSILYSRIEKRVDKMLEAGLLYEAKQAYEAMSKGTAVQAIGHKEFFPYFENRVTLQEAVETLKTETRRYAKRQLTWFNRDERIHWIFMDKTENALSEAYSFLERNGYFA